MGIKSALSKVFAAIVVKRIDNWKYNAVDAQERTMRQLRNILLLVQIINLAL